MTGPSASTMPFGEHLEELRKVLLRIIVLVGFTSVVAFCVKEILFDVLMAPLSTDFITISGIGSALRFFGLEPTITELPRLIATDISSQFMAHMTMALYSGILMASPYIVYTIFSFIAPALYSGERKIAWRLCTAMYSLFIVGLALSYFIMLPVASRFLITYSVSPMVSTMVDINSYLSLFVTLSLLMGAVFQMPVAIYILTYMGIVEPGVLRRRRRHAAVIIAAAAAIITPPDALTLMMVAVPLYALYEVSIAVATKICGKTNHAAENILTNG